MTDNFGNELYVGDSVVYTTTSAHSVRLRKGVIVEIGKQPYSIWDTTNREYAKIKGDHSGRIVTRYDHREFLWFKDDASNLIIKR